MNKPELSLEDRVALVTGASGGIGRAIVGLFGRAGATLFLNGVKEEKLAGLSEDLGQKGIPNEFKALDITTPGAAEALVRTAVDKWGRIDVLVNCAGINRPQKAEEVSETNWDDVMTINLKALFLVSQAAGRQMIKQRKGKIINISSQAGSVALPLRAAYCSSKGGVDQLTRTLALEWSKYNINVNAVAPTFVNGPWAGNMLKDKEFKKYVFDSIPLGRLAEPQEVAYATLFLATDFADMITGHILLVDGGWTIK
jgi:2-deoxy-D-gluconate 3-dehydrogenase